MRRLSPCPSLGTTRLAVRAERAPRRLLDPVTRRRRHYCYDPWEPIRPSVRDLRAPDRHRARRGGLRLEFEQRQLFERQEREQRERRVEFAGDDPVRRPCRRTAPSVKGGTISQGQLSGQTPTYIFPIINSENVTTGSISLVSNLYMPLYAGPKGARPETELCPQRGRQRSRRLQRRQDLHDPPQAGSEVVQRAADHVQGLPVLHRSDEGRAEGEPRELGAVRAG